FDNYDAIGRWRTEETVGDGAGDNPKVDASGELADGRKFGDAAAFKKLLLADVDQVNDAFIEKLATFALRRTMTIDHRTALARRRGGEAEAQRLRLYPEWRERADVADHESGTRLRAQRAIAAAGETSREHDADQRAASSERARAGARVPEGVAHGGEGQPG